MLTVSLITLIFYFHPSTSSATLFFRTVPILPEASGASPRCVVDFSAPVAKGDVIFKLDSSKQEAALETARRKIAEVDAALVAAKADVLKTEGQIQEAKSALQQAQDELDVKSELQRRNPGIVPQRDIEKLQVLVDGRQGSLDAANAAKQSAELRVSTLLPAEKASAEAALAQAQVDLDKTFIRAGVDGRVEQFSLRVGDIVNPLMRPAGILIPEGAGQTFAAGRLRTDRGSGHEAGHGGGSRVQSPSRGPSFRWSSQAFRITSRRVSSAAASNSIEAQNAARPGTILVFLEPLYKGGLEGVTAGSSCIVNAYTSNHELISSGKLGAAKSFGLHAVDAVGLVHAMLLRIQALLLPIKTLVLSGHCCRSEAVRHSEAAWIRSNAVMASDGPCRRRCRSGDGGGSVRLSLVYTPDDADRRGRIAGRRGHETDVGAGEPARRGECAGTPQTGGNDQRARGGRACFRRTRPISPSCEAMLATCRRRRPSSSSHTPWYCLLRPQDPRSPTSPA